MGKRAKGLDAVRQANSMKKQMLVSCKKYAEQLEKENYELKNDPNTVIGAFIGQFRELYGQNQRLSTLGAALIKKLGETVVMTRDEMEAYKDKRINIKWEIADGETIETATQFTFSYELQDAPPQGMPVQPTENPDSIPECTDPECTLPKDLKHRHDPTPIEGVVIGESIQTPESVAAVVEETFIDGINLGDDMVGKSLKYAEPELPTLDEVCNDPNCDATVNGPHIHGKKMTPQ